MTEWKTLGRCGGVVTKVRVMRVSVSALMMNMTLLRRGGGGAGQHGG